ncbi:MAG: hypothetical protein ACYDBJ_21260 [Aggregatilineales bacterium]
MTLRGRSRQGGALHTLLMEPFDIGMHSTDAGVAALQSRFTNWLRGLNSPVRFVTWLMPATLDDKIAALSRATHEVHTADPLRGDLLMEYRRHYERLQEAADYQRSLCGMALWTDENPRALVKTMSSSLEAVTLEGQWPPLLEGRYRVKNVPFGHLAPLGRPGGRLAWAFLTSYEFLPAEWNFFKPTKLLLSLNFPFALAIDIPYTYERIEGIEAVETTITAYMVHLAQLRGAEDSRAVQRINDCRRTLQELNDGDVLHKVTVTLAVAAPDLKLLKERVALVQNLTRSYFLLRHESGELLRRAVATFGGQRSVRVGLPDTSWRVTSRELALMLAPLGYRKLSNTDGIMRGEALEGGYPVFHNSWRDKRATHEVWVGMTGYGKTFANNCYLAREYAENGIAFDLLEPMGHGKHLAQAVGAAAFTLSARTTTLNPQDIVFDTLLEQKSHVTRLYETVLGRPLTGGQKENMERGLLGRALELLYGGFGDLNRVTPDQVPLCQDVCDVLVGLGESDRQRLLARELADEIASLCCGSGPWSRFLNGETNVDLARKGRAWIPPRVFMFHEMSDDPILLALAYTQVLSAMRRDSLIDDIPRIIVVDEVYRLMRYEALLDFLIEAAKTFRTRRKKLICIDQNMVYFTTGKARFILENSPIRVIFNQGPGIDVFHRDGAFAHLNSQHKARIAALDRFQYVFDVAGEGIWAVTNHASDGEIARFGSS